ncbi:MAG: pitrilysin family protein [Candidatus Poribacteria bacterium]|nr:pitrilysin family protein [Candidatus Poribacteria bacterium]
MTNRIKHIILTTIIIGILLVASILSAGTSEPYKLDNGLTVILHPVPTVKSVAFVVLYNIGENHDPVGKSGMAHLLEHMYVTAAAGETPARNVMQFTRHYPAGWNAQTGTDFTVIAGVVKAEQFSDEIKDVAARMNDLRITEADIKREVPRVKQELTNMYGGIPMLAGINHARALLHPIPQGGQRGGAIAHIQTITVAGLQQFWKDYYKPNNAILIVAGKFDVEEAKKSIHENLSQIVPGKLLPEPHPKSKPKTGDVNKINVQPVVPNATGVAAIGYAAPLPGSKEYVPFLIVHSRMAYALQTKFQMGKIQPIFYPPLDDPTTLVLQTELTSGENVDAVLKELDQRLQAALTSKLTPQEKQQTINMLALLGTVDIPDAQWGENMYSLAFSIGRQYQLQINGKEIRDAIQQVTGADIENLAKTIFAPEKRVTVIIELED